MKRILLFTVVVWLALLSPGYAQEKVVSGKVISTEDGKPIPGANIVVKGTTVGAVTDAEGAFSLGIPQGYSTLVVTFIGFRTAEVEIGTKSSIDVSLEIDAQQLSEVVVTGYSTQNQREVSGSVASIKADEISRVPLASFDQALQGKVAGILIVGQSGQPGAAANVVIRGKGSLNGSNSPLYILDGIEITANDFATLNQNDFETFSVLKDAISTAQYGSRGANGVILITSKKGKQGKTRLVYDVQYGTSKAPENKLVLMNSNQKLDYELANGNYWEWTAEDLERLRAIDTDWADVFFKTGKTQSHTLSVSGATDKTSYFLSGSIFDQTGTVENTFLKRYTGRVNIESNAGDFNFGINSTFGYSDFTNTTENTSGIAAPLNAIRWMNPYEKPYDDNGDYSVMVSGQPNALQELLENSNLRQQLKGVGNVYVGYTVPFIKGLSLRTSWGGDFTANERAVYVDPTTAIGGSALGGKGSYTRHYGRRFRYTGTSSITYTTKINTDHSLTVALYNEVVKHKSGSFTFTGYGLDGPFQNEAGITPGTATNGYIPAVGGSDTDGFNAEGADFRGGDNALLSYFAQVNYGLKDKYFLSVVGRRDGSSRFGSNKRYANFGSVGASWIVSEESFMASLKDNIFNELKFKISYGSAGNQAGISSYQARELYGRTTYNGINGLVQTQLENPELQWEKRTTFNTGLEMSTLNGRLNATVEFYNALTTELFLGLPLSNTTGYSSITTNIGELQNRGIELTLSGDIVKTTDFTWSANVAFTRNRNEVKKLVGNQTEIIGSSLRIGEPINSIFSVPYLGVNPTNGNAQYRAITGETTEVYSASDRVIVGSYEAPYFGGFGSTLSFKGIELTGFFSFVKGNKIYNNDRANVEDPSYLTDNLSISLLREWRNPGDITDIPRAGQTMQRTTTRFVEKGDFLRLRNLMLSYTLPRNLVSSIKLDSIKVYAQGQNLITWTDFLGFDPEISSGSLTGAQYPPLRTITFGLSVGF